jgi:hypothetical protein
MNKAIRGAKTKPVKLLEASQLTAGLYGVAALEILAGLADRADGAAGS